MAEKDELLRIEIVKDPKGGNPARITLLMNTGGEIEKIVLSKNPDGTYRHQPSSFPENNGPVLLGYGEKIRYGHGDQAAAPERVGQSLLGHLRHAHGPGGSFSKFLAKIGLKKRWVTEISVRDGGTPVPESKWPSAEEFAAQVAEVREIAQKMAKGVPPPAVTKAAPKPDMQAALGRDNPMHRGVQPPSSAPSYAPRCPHDHGHNIAM